jgi:hypothetical protein
MSSKNGSFAILAIPPAEYLLVIGKPEDNNYLIYQDSNGKPITYTLVGGQTIDTGTIKVDFVP